MRKQAREAEVYAELEKQRPRDRKNKSGSREHNALPVRASESQGEEGPVVLQDPRFGADRFPSLNPQPLQRGDRLATDALSKTLQFGVGKQD